MQKPQLDKVTAKGLENVEKLSEQMSSLTQEEIKKAPMANEEPVMLLSKEEIAAYDAPVIQPSRSFPTKSKPNPKEAKERRRGWEYVKCIAENLEIINEKIEFWHNKFLGDPCYFWEVPVNKPIYLPRFIAEHLSTRHYHRFTMADRSGREFTEPGATAGDERLVVKETRHRLNCRSVGFGF